MQFNARVHQSRAQRQRRGTGARVVIAILTVFLVMPLYRLQIAGAEQFSLQARQNRMRPLVVRAPRGTIYDRHGRIVAENIVGYQIQLMPAGLDTLHAQVGRLMPVLGLTDGDTLVAFRRYRRAPHLPMDVLRNASPDAVARLEERRFEFPEVLVQEYPKRHYPAAEAVAHMVGYVSEISEEELEKPEYEGYEPGRWIGKAGLEKEYEKRMGGEPGVRYLEIDAQGRIQRWLPEELGQRAVPGEDLHLYLDLDLQEYIAHIFPKEYNGAIIAIDPKTGGILAYYSHPTFNPNEFIGGVPPALWDSLNTDPRKPMLDRVGNSGQPAASTFKLAVAGIALDLGILDPEEYMPLPCSGGITYGGRYWRCWERSGHGRLNLIGAIQNSCNVYLYQVGLRLGLERFLETGERLGLSDRTGVDLPSEYDPTFPDIGWWERRYGYKPKQAEVISLSIGQGPLEMTALKLAQVYASLVVPGGRVPAPRLSVDIGAPPDTFHLDLDPREIWYLEAGMRRVMGPNGTARLSRLRDWEFIGKTGTAQNNGPDHGWFVGAAGPKGGEPEIAITMFLEHSLHGYIASGYVAEASNFYLDRKYGRPFQGWATPRHRLPRSLRINWDWTVPVVDPPMPAARSSSSADTDAAAGLATGGASADGGTAASPGGVGPGDGAGDPPAGGASPATADERVRQGSPPVPPDTSSSVRPARR
jgi:penicillin-binding protein 2